MKRIMSTTLKDVAIRAKDLKRQQREDEIKKIKKEFEYLRPRAVLFSRQLSDFLSDENSTVYRYLLSKAATGTSKIDISEEFYDNLIKEQVRNNIATLKGYGVDNKFTEPSSLFEKFLSIFYYQVPKHNYVYLEEFSGKYKVEILSEELSKIFKDPSLYQISACYCEVDDGDDGNSNGSGSDDYAKITIKF